jgi:hypothetical protein
MLFKNAHGLRKAILLRTSAAGGAAKPLFLFNNRNRLSDKIAFSLMLRGSIKVYVIAFIGQFDIILTPF